LSNFILGIVALCAFPVTARADLADTVARIKPSLVVVGTFNTLKSPPFTMRGTGFVVGNGTLVATNSHVVPEVLGTEASPDIVTILARQGNEVRRYTAKIVSRDPDYDLAVLRVADVTLPAMALGSADRVREGQSIAFSGFPIGGALGFSPVTHRGIISSITPIVLPSSNAQDLKDQSIRRLRRGPFPIFQLDGTAYPGNSGGPLFDPDSGEVLGILNMVFVKTTKEAVLEKPSGISYAIPVRHLADLLGRL
jgi:S1-C subfamily serine protease